MSRNLKKTEYGFTLIEMIVSLALFSVVVTVSVGALLMLIATNDKLQGEQSVMTNLSFALDSMTREIRTGTSYICVSSNTVSGVFGSSPLETYTTATPDCPNSSAQRFRGVIFNEAGDSITGATDNKIMYYYDADPVQGGKIYRRVGNQAAESIVSSGIFVEDAKFFVTGGPSVDDTGDTTQPTVSVHIQAVDVNDAAADKKSYFVQTTVTQRTLDI